MSKLRLWSAGRLNPNESWGRSPSHWSRSNDASFRFMSACIMTAAAWTHPNDGWRAEDEGAGLAGWAAEGLRTSSASNEAAAAAAALALSFFLTPAPFERPGLRPSLRRTSQESRPSPPPSLGSDDASRSSPWHESSSIMAETIASLAADGAGFFPRFLLVVPAPGPRCFVFEVAIAVGPLLI